MKKILFIGFVSILSATISTAYAQEPLTREQVQAELAQAIRDGNVQVGDSSETTAELYPWAYPQASQAPGLTREQVVADLKKAQQDGDIEVGDSGLTLAELNPSLYPHAQQGPGLTREQVKTELAQAIRNGELPLGGDSDQTLSEEYPDLYAPAHQHGSDGKVASN